MKKIKILGTGLTGLVGSRIVELLSKKYEFENLSFDTGVDITQKETVKKRISTSAANIILHLAAKTNVDSCEQDKNIDIELLNTKKNFTGFNTAWAVNVEGTRNIVEAAKRDSKKVIYISTDFIFDGINPPPDGYKEEDTPNPINWYGITKYEGEKIVQEAGIPYLICRIAFPYRANFALKKDFVRAILEKLKNNQRLMMVSDMIITPTFIDDIAYALDQLIEASTMGVYHVVGETSYTPLEASFLIAEILNLNNSLIEETKREVYFAKRAPRPFSLKLKNDKLKKLGIKMSSFEEGLKKIKKQMELI